MQTKFFSALVAAFLVLAAAAQDTEKTLPKELQPLVPKGYQMLDLVKGDLNGDKLQDYLLILKKKGEDTMTFDNPDWDADRPLLLILRQSNGTLKTAVTNSEIVMCRNCGGAMGDPYMGMTVTTGTFSLEFYGGSSWKWGETITFRYDRVKKNWYLHTHHITSFHGLDPENTTEDITISRSEAGNISLEKYRSEYNSDTSQWQVKAAKTYFYESPVPGSKPRKGYLLKGDVVKGFKTFTNFIQCSFENDKGTTTLGFILRKDLVRVAGH